MVVEFTMEDNYKVLLEKIQHILHVEHRCGYTFLKGTFGASNNYVVAPFDLFGTEEDKSFQFKSLLRYVEQTILKPWSDNQSEFLCLTYHEDDSLNQVNCLSVLTAFAFAKGDRTCLEEVKSYFTSLDQYHMYHPKVGFLMNNLGIMFTEVALYEESDECFRIANICFQQQKHCLKNAVVTLNQAFLKKVVGEYEKAADLTTAAASLCHDISMRKTNDVQLPAKLLGRIADMLKEFGNYQMLKKILTTVVHFDIPGADKTATAVLSRQLMIIQLEGMERKIEAKEVKDFISHLLALLAKPDASKISMNAELLRIVIIAAKIFRSIGQCKEACELLKKLQSIFLLVHGENSFLYGSLLYQMGSFLHGCGRFNDAETALKQAEGILICFCGENHHSVALCRSVLGSCILLKGNAKDALEYLNEALTVFRKLNPNHPEVGEILLKVAFLYSEEGNFQQAQETVQEAEVIFISSCGEVSLKTANAYFQVGMIFQRFKELHMPAVGKIQEGIKMMVNLGINVSHPDVVFWRSLLGSLKQSLGLVKEAEKCFIDVQNSVGGIGSKETEIITPVNFLHSQDRADVRGGKSSFAKAQVISLVNLVHMERGNKRIQYLDKLVCCLKKEQMEEIQIRDFAGQDLYLFTHRIPLFNKPAVLVIHTFDSLGDISGADYDNGTDSKMFLSSSAEKSPFSLFLRIQGRGLDMKEINCLTSSFPESVKILFLQPKFRKSFVEGKDVYVELPARTDIFSLSSYLDCLPLLVELELTKSQGLYDDFDYLTSWQSSVDSATHPAPHVSYFSYSCVDQRETEFVWDHLIQNFGQQLALNGFQESMISDVSLEENVARFIVQESNLFLTIDVRNLSVIVKCCTIKESCSNCHCSSIRNMLTVTIESLFEILNVDIESSVQLGCEGVHGFVLGNDDHDGNCSQSVDKDLVGSGSTLETWNSTMTCLCSISGGAEANSKKWTVGKLHNKNADIIHPLCHPCDNCQHVDVGLCLLECLLNQPRPALHTREKELNNGEPTSNDVNECDSHITHNSSLSSSIFSSATSSSLNSVPASPSTFSLAGDSLFTSTTYPSESLSSVDKLKEYNADSSSDVVSVCGSRELLSDNALRITKCSELSVSLPKEPSLSVDTCAFSQSSYKECLHVEQSCSYPGTQNTKQSKTFTIENINGAEELKIRSTEQKAAAQNISSKDKDSSVGNDSKLSTTQCVEDLHANQSSKLEAPDQDIQGPLSGASSDKVDTGTATEDFFRTLLANLEDELAASHKDHHELEQQIRKLEENLKQSEEEKRELQADLGKFLFLEEKAKRRGRLLGGATAVQEPGLLLHSRLLEISDSLSSVEVKKIKFLLKSKVSGFRLARITEAFELFEELEMNGLFPLNYIGQLLGGIQRYDLLEKLGIHAPPSRSRKGSANGSVESDHASNSAKSAPVQDNILDEQTDAPEMKIQMDHALSSKSYFELTGSDENGTSLRAEEKDPGESQYSSILSSGSSVEEDSDIRLSSKSVGNVVLVEESPKSSIPSDVMFVSNSNCSSSDLVANSDKTAPGSSNSILQAFCEVDGFQLVSGGSQSASGYSNPSPTTWDTQGISHVMARPGNEPADEDGQLREACATSGEERVVKSHDFCDGAAMVVPYSTKIITECTKTDSSVSSDSSLARTQNVTNGGILSSTQQHVFSDGEGEIAPPSSDVIDWKRLGARPKKPQRTGDGQVPKEPVVYITDGLAGDFLARHTQDKALHDSIYQTDVGSLFNDIPSQGTSFIDGDISQFSRAQPYFGDCQAASRTEPHGRTGHSLVSGSSRHLGGSSYVEPFSDNSGLWPSHLGNDSSSLYSNYLSRNTTSTAANNYSLQSDFVHNSSRFAGVDHFDRQIYLPSAKQTPFPPIASDPVLNSYPGMAGSSFADPSWTGAALTLPGDPGHNAPRFSSFLSEQLTDPAHDANRFAGNDAASAFISNQGTDEPAQKPNFALGNSRTTTGNIDDDANSSAQYQLGNSTTFDGVLAARSTHDTSVLEPHTGDADNNSALNNTDFGTDSIEASDNSLLALERRVAEACALVERVLREREEREQFGREIERKEQLIREQRARERREREERELREAENWPQQQEAINAHSQWLCEHYQRHCRVRFPCCTQFYPCHRCHNISKACDNEEAKACHATHLKCSHCQHEQEIGEDSAKCRKCGGKMSAYFCPICKHFTSVDKNPYHCEKCGICRIHQDKSFHCEVCNVCLDKRLEGNHKCRPDSGHDECCICLEDAFSGCQILPCSHKVHRECAIAMIQNGIRTCPICRHPLYSQSRE